MNDFKVDTGIFSAEYTESKESLDKIIEGWRFFLETEVVVGIPKETNAGRSGGNTNAGLLYENEQGSPAKHIPPRPVLKPALAQEDVKEEIGDMMKDAADAALDMGDIDKAKDCFEKAGMLGRDACRNYITGGNLAPNAPRTIARKHSSQPLIDTGSMFGSISYAVRKK